MLSAAHVLDRAKAHGFDFFTGVPCSFLTPLINRAISDPAIRYVGATSEGEAVGIAAGAQLAGARTVVMCQNSGLGNMINPLTSLNAPFRIPSLLIVTWRGEPGIGDEPQHDVMGQVTHRLLDTIGIAHARFPQAHDEVDGVLSAAGAHMRETGLPYALVLPNGTLAAQDLTVPTPPEPCAARLHDLSAHGPRPPRNETLRTILAQAPDSAAIVATTGKCGRELFTLADRAQHLYLVGSMGCASAVGLGVALRSTAPVIVVDGDGAALMKLGNVATIGAMRPGNLVHVVLDNAVHDSTGGQATVSAGVDFARIAAACGYASAWSCDDLDGFGRALRPALAEAGPALIQMRIAPGSLAALGRPTIAPSAVAERFRGFLRGA